MSVGFRRACACMIAVGSFLMAGAPEVRAASEDAKLCAKESGDTAIEACSRAIKSGRYKGRDLAHQYLYRGVERGLKQEYALALADYGEAAKIDQKYADAFYNRCVILNLKKDYDSAIADCSQAVKLGPTPISTRQNSSGSEGHRQAARPAGAIAPFSGGQKILACTV